MRAGRIRWRRNRGVAAAALALAATIAAVGLPTALAGSETTELISRASGGGGAKGDGTSVFPSVTKDGRYVAFRSESRNLHPDDIDGRKDVFVRDRDENTTILVSRASGAAGVKGNHSSFNPRISADGRRVVFRSNSDNFVPEDPGQGSDIYVRNLQTDKTTLVSRASGVAGAKADGESFSPSISSDGRLIAFRSLATNLDPADTDTIEDIYVRDLNTNITTLVSRASGPSGVTGNAVSTFPVISGDGSLVAFRSEATNLHADDKSDDRDIYARELGTGKTILISRAKGANGKSANADSTFAAVSETGRYIAFDSLADNLTPDDKDKSADVLLRDLNKNKTSLISRAGGFDGPKQNEGAAEPSISFDGRYVAFHATATNLDTAGSDSASLDVFVRDTKIGRTILISKSSGKKDANLTAEEPWISGDGSLVVFQSEATNLSKDDNDGIEDVFAYEVPAIPRCLGRKATEMAADGATTIGSKRSDVIVGNPGPDKIKAKKGKDRVCGGDGRDRIIGGPGGDRLNGEGGKDILKGGKGGDRLKGGKGGDKLNGGKGNDKCTGGPGRDKETSC